MAERFPTPAELRAQARHHRDEALRMADPKGRAMRKALADEYARLAAVIEFETAEGENAS
jgi:hypothetical protein